MRGSKMSSDRTGALHLVSDYATEAGLVLAQRAVERKSNEITAIPELDERGWRLFAAGEARSAGWGGLAAVSKITGLARSTINRGKDDLDAAALPRGLLAAPAAGVVRSLRTIRGSFAHSNGWSSL